MNIEILKWIQLAQTVFVFILPALIVALIASRRKGCSIWSWWQMDQGMDWKVALYAILAIVVAAPGVNLLAELNQQMTLPACLSELEAYMKQMEESAAELTEAFLQSGSLIINIGLMAILPAFSEELTFRGTLMRSHRHWCIWLVAILFSAIHMQFYGFIPRMLLGAWFGYMVAWTGSLWVPMLMHATNNCLAVLTYHYAYTHGIDIDTMDAIGVGDTLWLGILSLILTATGIYVIRRYSRTR